MKPIRNVGSWDLPLIVWPSSSGQDPGICICDCPPPPPIQNPSKGQGAVGVIVNICEVRSGSGLSCLVLHPQSLPYGSSHRKAINYLLNEDTHLSDLS